MHFGLHYLLSCADGQSPVARYRDTLEQATRAEELGFESVWPVEHHFHRAVSILPSPALLLAAVAARLAPRRSGSRRTARRRRRGRRAPATRWSSPRTSTPSRSCGRSSRSTG